MLAQVDVENAQYCRLSARSLLCWLVAATKLASDTHISENGDNDDDNDKN